MSVGRSSTHTHTHTRKKKYDSKEPVAFSNTLRGLKPIMGSSNKKYAQYQTELKATCVRSNVKPEANLAS